MIEVLSKLLVPSGMAASLFVLGVLLLCLTRTRRWATWLFGISAGATVVFSTGHVATLLMSPLEYAYPAMLEPRKATQARHIVVLTAWANRDLNMPLSARMNESSVYRVMTALELYHDRPDCDLIVSGESKVAHIMAEMLREAGVPADRIRVEDASHSTEESAEYLRGFVGEDDFFLVTSAGHMPRSMESMKRRDLAAIAAPTDFRLPRDWRNASLAPHPDHLESSDLAVHEYAGRLYYALTGD